MENEKSVEEESSNAQMETSAMNMASSVLHVKENLMNKIMKSVPVTKLELNEENIQKSVLVNKLQGQIGDQYYVFTDEQKIRSRKLKKQINSKETDTDVDIIDDDDDDDDDTDEDEKKIQKKRKRNRRTSKDQTSSSAIDKTSSQLNNKIMSPITHYYVAIIILLITLISTLIFLQLLEALAVRFLTNKYLSEYSHGGNISYERNIYIDGKTVDIYILDTSGKETCIGLKRQGMLEEIDGYVIVYSVTDKRSFFKSRELLRTIHMMDKRVFVALIGNKDDLSHLRNISWTDGYKESLKYSRCSFHECSAAREAENVKVAFQTFLRQVFQSKEDRRQFYNMNNFKLSNLRRNSAGNSILSTWLRRPRFPSTNTRSIKKTRTFTM